MPNFRPAVKILLVYFGGGVVLVVVVVTGVKQSQLLDLSLGLGLEFDKSVDLEESSQRLSMKTGVTVPWYQRKLFVCLKILSTGGF